MASQPSTITLIILLPRAEFSGDLKLEIPYAKIHKLSNRPLKYLLYLGFAVVNATGALSYVEPEDVDEADNEADELTDRKTTPLTGAELDVQTLPDVSATYHFKPDDNAELHLVDAYRQTSRVTSTAYTEARMGFKKSLEDRDGCCRLMGVDALSSYCQGCHIIPHSKGSEYIESLTTLFGRGDEAIEDINDQRNGILLYGAFHLLWKSLAFLPTPNPVLGPRDVNPLPSAETSSRVTMHWFPQFNDPFIRLIPDTSFDLRPLDDVNLDPPDWLLHFAYAARAWKHWGKDADNGPLRKYSDKFYPKGRNKVAVEKTLQDEQKEKAKRTRQVQAEERENRKRSRSERMDESDAFDLIANIWLSRAKRKARSAREANEKWVADWARDPSSLPVTPTNT